MHIGFKRLVLWAAIGAAGVPLLTSCGAGEVIAVLGYIPAAGGQYSANGFAGPGPGFTAVTCQTTTPAPGSAQPCALSLIPDPAADLLFDTRYTVTANGPLVDDDSVCANATGTVDGQRLLLGSCFTGEFKSVNELTGTTGNGTARRLVKDFFPDVTTGVWVDIHDSARRFKFTSDVVGCELTAGNVGVVNLVLTDSDVRNGVDNEVTAFTIVNRVQTWRGVFVGGSGMRLALGNQTLEIQRQRDTTTLCP